MVILLYRHKTAPSIFQSQGGKPPTSQLFVNCYLKDVLSVVHAVHPDVVLQRGAVGVGEEHQPQTLGGAHVQWLPHQCEGAQLLREKPARLGFELAVKGLWHQFFSHQEDILEEARGKNKVGMEGQAPNFVGRKGNVFAWCLREWVCL